MCSGDERSVLSASPGSASHQNLCCLLAEGELLALLLASRRETLSDWRTSVGAEVKYGASTGGVKSKKKPRARPADMGGVSTR